MLKKLFITVVTLLVFICNAHGSDLFVDGYVSQSYWDVSKNHTSEEGFNGTQAGLYASYFYNSHLTTRGWLKYEPAFADKAPLDVESLLADISISFLGGVVGTRIGRLFLTYSLHGDTRSDPSGALMINAPAVIIWPNQRKVYDSGDGYQIYHIGGSGNLSYEIDYSHTILKNMEPHIEYNRGNDYVTPKQTEISVLHIEADYRNFTFRLDKLSSVITQTIKKEAYTETILGQLLPEDSWYIGDISMPYDIIYKGLQYTGEQFGLLYEHTYFRNDTEKGTQDKYLALIQKDEPEEEVTFQNITAYYYRNADNTYYLGRGWYDLGDADTTFGSRHGWHNYIGLKKSISNWIIKFQYEQIHSKRHIELRVNEDKKKHEMDWSKLGIQFTYSFNIL